jgi:hypothetical protein
MDTSRQHGAGPELSSQVPGVQISLAAFGIHTPAHLTENDPLIELPATIPVSIMRDLGERKEPPRGGFFHFRWQYAGG